MLRDCSFTVTSGERVALVGATGAGKTTIARLLNRFYDVAKGQVLVEGVDVREWDLTALRRHVGLVQQDTVLFTGTIEANLRLGLDGEAGRADIERAAEMRCRAAGRRRSASAARTSRRDSASCWPSRAHLCTIRPCWCSTRRRRASTPNPRR